MSIAILGGTFDPIHNGHLAAARAVAEAFDIDQVLFMPAFAPPHKTPIGMTSAFHRFAMVALATAPFERFRVSTAEVDTLGPQYSVETLEVMRQTHPGASFVFITGTDMFQEIEEWKDYRHLFELTSFAVVNRPGFPIRNDLAPVETLDRSPKKQLGEPPSVYYFPELAVPVSSTEIRDEAHRGSSLKEWLPAAVETYIVRNELYQ